MLRYSNRLPILALIALALLLAQGCGSNDEREEETVSAAELYEQAKRSMDNGAYDRAISLYRQLQSRFPFGRYTEQAQLELAYSYFKNFEPELAITTLNRFVRTYPTHPNIDYAYYLKGLVNFSRDTGLLTRILPVETIGRDQTHAKESFRDFGELLQKFPDSTYAPDARERMLFLRNAMARYELTVARYYLRRDAYVAAANRAQYIVENYQETPQVADALSILAQAYDKLDLDAQSEDVARVLEANAPEHPYLTGNNKDNDGWLSKLWPF